MWQQMEPQQRAMEKQGDFWLEELGGELPVLRLPTDFPRPGMQSFEGSSISFFLDEGTTEAVEGLGKRYESTLFMTLTAAFNILLARLSGQEEIIIGTPVAARRHADLERIIGMFVNTLALRHFPVGGKRVDDFIREVNGKTLAHFDNQEYPFEELVDRVSPARDTSRNPLFDVMLILQNQAEFEVPGGALPSPDEFIRGNRGIARFDLTISAALWGERLLVTTEYCTRLFKEETAERVARYFKRVLAGMAAEPHLPLGAMEILSEEEKEQLLKGFNDTFAPLPENPAIHRLFEEKFFHAVVLPLL